MPRLSKSACKRILAGFCTKPSSYERNGVVHHDDAHEMDTAAAAMILEAICNANAIPVRNMRILAAQAGQESQMEQLWTNARNSKADLIKLHAWLSAALDTMVREQSQGQPRVRKID